MYINSAQEIFYVFREFIVYMNGINLQFSHSVKQQLFKWLFNCFNQGTKRNHVGSKKQMHLLPPEIWNKQKMSDAICLLDI